MDEVPTLLQCDPILIISAAILFLNKSYLGVVGVRTSACLGGGYTIDPVIATIRQTWVPGYFIWF